MRRTQPCPLERKLQRFFSGEVCETSSGTGYHTCSQTGVALRRSGAGANVRWRRWTWFHGAGRARRRWSSGLVAADCADTTRGRRGAVSVYRRRPAATRRPTVCRRCRAPEKAQSFRSSRTRQQRNFHCHGPRT